MATTDSVAANRPFCASSNQSRAYFPFSRGRPRGTTRFISYETPARVSVSVAIPNRVHPIRRCSLSFLSLSLSLSLPFRSRVNLLSSYFSRVSLATQVLRKGRINRRKLTVQKKIKRVFSGTFGEIRVFARVYDVYRS